MKELEDKEAEYIKLLQIQNRSYNLLSKWIGEYQRNNKSSLYAVIMEVISQSNQNELMEVYREMAKLALNEDNRTFLMDMMKRFELDKKWKEEGKEEGIKEGSMKNAENLLKLGVNEEIVAKGTGLTMEQVLEIKFKNLGGAKFTRDKQSNIEENRQK